MCYKLYLLREKQSEQVKYSCYNQVSKILLLQYCMNYIQTFISIYFNNIKKPKQEKQSIMWKSNCKRKLSFIVSSACLVIAVVFIVISTITLPSVLKKSINEELKMAPETYQYWGQSPGMTKSVTKRNFTFFNFTNPREFLYQNKTPVFNQINGYLLQQRFNYTDYNYTENMDQVFYNDWMFFTQLQGTKSLDEKLHVVNVGPLGFWYQLDLVGMPTFALQGFGGLFMQLSETFKTQAIGQGISSQFLASNTSWKSICEDNQIPQTQCRNVWQDPQHGLSNQNNYQIWVDFAYYNDQNSQSYIKNYFGFDDLQIHLLQTIFQKWADTVNGIIENWFCHDIKNCSSSYLTLLQLSSGTVTANPPSGDAVDSICDTGNITCIGQPQISKFLKNQFRKLYPDQKYQKLKFSIQTFNKLFMPYKGTLLNIGNLTLLFETGQKFDIAEKIGQRNVLLEQIKRQTHAETNDHAFVIWEWVKFFTSDFVIKKTKGGSEKNSGIGGVFSQAFYEAYSNFGNWILDQYLNILGLEQIANCQNFVKQTITGISNQKANNLCYSLSNNGGYSKIFQPCFMTAQGKERFRMKNELTLSEFGEYCDSQANSFYSIALKIHQRIYNHYKCSPAKGLKICSNYELSMKQFISSSITLNPISNKIKTYPQSLTVKTWNSQLDEFEYKNYLKSAYRNENINSQQFTEKQLIDMLSFDKLFSASIIMELMLENDEKKFQQLYYWKNMTLLKNFVRFITIEVGFGGFTQERTVRELLFGYEDPFLKTLQQTDTMMGGDPSIDPVIMLNEPNITEAQAKLFPQSVYTGYSDIQLTRQYSSLFGYKYITYNKTWFDGYDIKSQFISPYKSYVAVKGTDAIQHPPGLDQKSSIYCLIGNIYRTAQLDYTQHDQMYGVDLLTFKVAHSFLADEQSYPKNSVFYQKFEGFHNITFLGVPLHISKNNFLSCPQNWSNLVETYDQSGQHKITASQIDDTVLKVQPITGALFFATVRLQTNYHFQSDILFSPDSRMLPITNVIRQGEIDQQIVSQLFGDLMMALTLQKVLLILSLVILVLCMGLFGYSCYRATGSKVEEREINRSLIDSSGDVSSMISGPDTIIKSKDFLKTEYQSNRKDLHQTQIKPQDLKQISINSDTVVDQNINTTVVIQ